ncbi:hypothetical protein V5N11_003835 [Cardamine amara subsp. amara]|uniref:Retrotransposon Copia-like N-terminal domain-containing protein n=1 Tax=Cardamine amara subsp. amara TaxID=228776 RepID=A0ABD1C742_CARAN
MVTLRRTSKRVARGTNSSSAKKSAARSKTNRPIPAIPEPSPASEPIPAIHTQNSPILVTAAANLSHFTVLVQTFANPALRFRNSSQEQFNFDGIQYSPYFLSSGDNPGVSIFSEVLDGTNYNTWSIAITVALDAKNKLMFIDGSLPRCIHIIIFGQDAIAWSSLGF